MKSVIITLLALLLSPLSWGQSTWVGSSTIRPNSVVPIIPPAASLAQTCSANASSTSVSCATSGAVPSQNFTAGQTIYVAAYAGNTSLTSTPTGSGAGCPSIWQNINNGTDASGGNFTYSYGTAQNGACTITQSETGTATGMFIIWWAISNGSGHVDGTGAWLVQSVGAGTTVGASYTTTHNGDLILGMVVEDRSSGDSTFAAISPFSASSPGQLSTGLSPQGWPQMAASASQATAGTTTITWTQGVSTQSFSLVLGVY